MPQRPKAIAYPQPQQQRYRGSQAEPFNEVPERA